MTTLLEARDLDVTIGDRTLVEALDLCIQDAQSWAVLGPNGAGKTTLLHHLAGLRSAHRGQIRLDGGDLAGLRPRERAQRIGALLQHSGDGFGQGVLETVLGGRHPHLPALGWETAADLSIARDAIAAMDLQHLAGRALDTLSGGERRRVEIARLLTQQTAVSLLDEPMNHLDPGHQSSCLRVLRHRCVGPDRALVMVMHDLNLAFHACDHWLLLDGDGGWSAGPRERIANPGPLSRAFGHPIRQIDDHGRPLFLAQY